MNYGGETAQWQCRRLPLRFSTFIQLFPFESLMKASGRIPQTIHSLADLLKRLVSLYIESVKLTAAEKLTVVLSAGVLLIVALVLGIFALAFISGACIELLALVLPAWASYSILGGFFLLLVIGVLVFRKTLVVNPIARFVSKLVFENNVGNDKDDEEK